jgi:anti-sigma factor RsiW
MTPTKHSFSDEDVMAYADGQADGDLAANIDAALLDDAKLAARIETLQAQTAELRGAFDLALQDAPQMPAHLVAKRPSPARFGVPLALAASFALGMVAMNILQPAPGWIDRVASYQALYAPETLGGAVQEEVRTAAVLSETRNRIGVDLAAIPQLDGMTFKRAQMLAMDAKPLVQIAYLAEDGTPFALCIVQVTGADHGVTSTRSHDLEAASWTTDGVGFVLIGGADAARVTDLAKGIAAQI